MEQEIMTKEEFDFFKNDIALRKKFSNLYPFVKMIYDEVVDVMPETDWMLLGRLNKTNAKYSKNVTVDLSDGTMRRPFETVFGIDFQRSVFMGMYELEKMSSRTGNANDIYQKIKSAENENVNFFLRLNDSANLDNIQTSAISEDIIRHLKLEKDKIGTNEDYYFLHARQYMPQRYYDTYIKAMKKESFIHEILHALAYCEIGALEFKNFDPDVDDEYDFDIAGNLDKIETYPAFSFKDFQLDDFMYVQNGADIAFVSIADFTENMSIGFRPLFNNFVANLKEEAIVENWASEMADKFGVFAELDKNNIVYERDYGTIPFVAGMFNIACDNEWKSQHIYGIKGLNCDMQDVNKMDELFANYLSCFYKDIRKFDITLDEKDVPKVVSAMTDIVKFCDKKVQDKIACSQISKEDQEKYRFNRYMFTNMDATSKFICTQGVRMENNNVIYQLQKEIGNQFREKSKSL